MNRLSGRTARLPMDGHPITKSAAQEGPPAGDHVPAGTVEPREEPPYLTPDVIGVALTHIHDARDIASFKAASRSWRDLVLEIDSPQRTTNRLTVFLQSQARRSAQSNAGSNSGKALLALLFRKRRGKTRSSFDGEYVREMKSYFASRAQAHGSESANAPQSALIAEYRKNPPGYMQRFEKELNRPYADPDELLDLFAQRVALMPHMLVVDRNKLFQVGLEMHGLDFRTNCKALGLLLRQRELLSPAQQTYLTSKFLESSPTQRESVLSTYHAAQTDLKTFTKLPDALKKAIVEQYIQSCKNVQFRGSARAIQLYAHDAATVAAHAATTGKSGEAIPAAAHSLAAIPESILHGVRTSALEMRQRWDADDLYRVQFYRTANQLGPITTNLLALSDAGLTSSRVQRREISAITDSLRDIHPALELLSSAGQSAFYGMSPQQRDHYAQELLNRTAPKLQKYTYAVLEHYIADFSEAKQAHLIANIVADRFRTAPNHAFTRLHAAFAKLHALDTASFDALLARVQLASAA